MHGKHSAQRHVQWLMNDKPLGDNDDGKLLRTELNFVQFRKILELIAFSSLTAHKEDYARAHKNFGQHWRAVDMLKVIEGINPHFYPRPLEGPVKHAAGHWHFTTMADNFLTRTDFEALYDACGDVLHSNNPFSGKQPRISLPFNPTQYADRIKNLLKLHAIQMAGGQSVWLVTVTNDKVLVQNANATPPDSTLSPNK